MDTNLFDLFDNDKLKEFTASIKQNKKLVNLVKRETVDYIIEEPLSHSSGISIGSTLIGSTSILDYIYTSDTRHYPISRHIYASKWSYIEVLISNGAHTSLFNLDNILTNISLYTPSKMFTAIFKIIRFMVDNEGVWLDRSNFDKCNRLLRFESLKDIKYFALALRFIANSQPTKKDRKRGFDVLKYIIDTLKETPTIHHKDDLANFIKQYDTDDSLKNSKCMVEELYEYLDISL